MAMIAERRNISAERLSHVTRILKIISHPVRLEILEILEAEEPLNVGCILDRLSQTVEASMLSHHLTKMRDLGLLQAKKEGKHVLYSISDRQVLKIFDCMELCSIL